MDQQCTAMTAIPPLLRIWSRNTSNLCLFEEIPAYWQKNDVLTFLAEVGMYDASLYQNLDATEKEQEHQFKSEYFKKRFTVSRSVLRQILRHITGTENNADAILTKEKNRRIRVNNRKDIFISLSYSGSCIAITVGKRKIGSDIERLRRKELPKIKSIPLFKGLATENRKDHDHHLLQVWTLLEAYAKFHDMSLYPLTQERFFLSGTHFVSYCIDRHAIVSLAYGGISLKDTMFWIDPDCRLASSVVGKKAASSPPFSEGDTYVRT